MADTSTTNASCCDAYAAECSPSECSHEKTSYRPRCDIRDTDDELVLYADLPGVRPEDLDVQFEDSQLTIHGKVLSRRPNDASLSCEYGVGDFHRTFSVKEAIDVDAISAQVKNGVLKLRLPKVEATKPRRIKIES